MRKKIFVTSDLHIGHENSIKFDQRPFRDLDHMHSVFVRNYNATVPPDGICYFLGDLGLSKSEIIKEVYSQMHGTKILILGNHDKKTEIFYEAGFSAVLYGAVVYLSGERVTMSHCPLKGVYREPTDHFENVNARGGNWHGENKNHRFTFSDEGQFHLHGHIHSSISTPHKKIVDGRQMDIGVVAHHYRPVSFSHIESWIAKTILQERSL